MTVHGQRRSGDGPAWGRGWGPPPWAPGGHGQAGPGSGPPERDEDEGEGRPWGPFGGWSFGGPGGHWSWGPQARARGGPFGRARRGDVRSAVLVLLAERPMHGYEIITELVQRTDGMWKPSPGSIYPTLQLLEDEGLVVATEEGGAGKRRFTLTADGQAAAAELAKGPAPWERVGAGAPVGARELRHAMGRFMPAVGQVFMSGDPRQLEAALGVLEDARRRLYAILAGEGEGRAGSGSGPTTPGTAAPGPEGQG